MRRARPLAVGQLSAAATALALDSRGFASTQIITRWPEIVGDDLAAFALPVEIRGGRQRADGATLVLQVASGAAATLLQMKAPQLIERVNAFLGRRTVGRIEARQGPVPRFQRLRPAPPAPLQPAEEAGIDQKIKNIVSPEVKSALHRLGLSVARRNAGGGREP